MDEYKMWAKIKEQDRASVNDALKISLGIEG